MAVHVLAYWAAILASQIARNRERHLVDEVPWAVVVFDFNAVVGVDARAAKLTIATTQRIFAHTVVVREY
jgi:hypothetical protein